MNKQRYIWRIQDGSVNWKYDGEPQLVSLWDTFDDAWEALCDCAQIMQHISKMDDGLETKVPYYTVWENTEYYGLDRILVNQNTIHDWEE